MNIIRLFTCILTLALLMPLFSGCQKEGTSSSATGSVKETTDTKNSEQPKTKKKSVISYGMESDPGGLEEGETAPLFSAESTEGKTVNLSEMLKSGPVVMMFYRGQWCPVCSRYMSAMQDSVHLIRKTGASVIAVTPETKENANIFIEKSGTDITIVPDKGGKIMQDYRVAFRVTESYQEKIRKRLKTDIAENNDAEEALLPVPATYVINTDGKVKKVFYNPKYTKRAGVAEILSALSEN